MSTTEKHEGKKKNECVTISPADIRNVTNGAKSVVVSNSLIGLCRSISTITSRELRDRYGVSPNVCKFEIGPPRVAHFAVVLPLHQYKTIDNIVEDYPPDSRVVIDPTIKQFSVENMLSGRVDVALAHRCQLPDVGIYLPECEERIYWYHLPEDTIDRSLNSVRTPMKGLPNRKITEEEVESLRESDKIKEVESRQRYPSPNGSDDIDRLEITLENGNTSEIIYAGEDGEWVECSNTTSNDEGSWKCDSCGGDIEPIN